mmetsp:Transcript_11165/g.27252  ORF Transcript_11165/g.27252 Transcript_11165/m.27252 type:complete len:208 (+) Transcript_11165:1720-2343(+)
MDASSPSARSSPTTAGAESHAAAAPNVGSSSFHTNTLEPVFCTRTETVCLWPWSTVTWMRVDDSCANPGFVSSNPITLTASTCTQEGVVNPSRILSTREDGARVLTTVGGGSDAPTPGGVTARRLPAQIGSETREVENVPGAGAPLGPSSAATEVSAPLLKDSCTSTAVTNIGGEKRTSTNSPLAPSPGPDAPESPASGDHAPAVSP